jgi:hypothetical protein
MSQHIIENDKLRWIFGWDVDNRSFYLTKQDKSRSNGDDVFRVGIRPREIAEADGLFDLASMVGLDIPIDTRLQLHRDKEYERSVSYVLHYPREFVHGFKTDSLTHAELLKDALAGARPDEELLIRRIVNYTSEES